MSTDYQLQYAVMATEKLYIVDNCVKHCSLLNIFQNFEADMRTINVNGFYFSNQLQKLSDNTMEKLEKFSNYAVIILQSILLKI